MNSKECELEAQLESINAEVREIDLQRPIGSAPTGCQCRIWNGLSWQLRSAQSADGFCATVRAKNTLFGYLPTSNPVLLPQGDYHMRYVQCVDGKNYWLQYGFVKGPNVEPHWDGVGMREPRPIHSRLSLVSSDRRQ